MHAGDVFGTRRSFNCTQLVFQLLPDDRRERLPLWRLHVAIIDVFALQLCGSDGENGSSLFADVRFSAQSALRGVCSESERVSQVSRHNNAPPTTGSLTRRNDLGNGMAGTETSGSFAEPAINRGEEI